VGGALQYIATMSFMVGDYSQRLTKKTRHILVFLRKEGDREHTDGLHDTVTFPAEKTVSESF
jgi:hypothetical protein